MLSLLEEACLHASPLHGGLEEHSVRSALLNAHTLDGRLSGTPTERAALLRQLLLPLVVDALGRPQDENDWAAWFHAGRWAQKQTERLQAYFAMYADRFHLLHPVHPFAQVADLRTEKNETKSAGLIVATAATGNNVPLFASRTEGDRLELSTAQALTALLHTHCWDTAAIKTGAVGDARVKGGKTSGNPTGPLGQMGVTLLVGRTLYETLLLNIPFGPPLPSDDLPQWRRREGDPVPPEQRVSTAVWHERMPAGLLDLWTWQSRRVRLVPEETEDGPKITRVVVAAGDRMPLTPEFEPHTMWRIEPTAPRAAPRARKPRSGKPMSGQRPPRRPLRMRPSRAGWRDMQALLALERESRDAAADSAGFATSRVLDQAGGIRSRIGSTYPLRVELCGVAYGTQSAVVEDAMSDVLPLPLAALETDSFIRSAVLEVAGQTEELADAVNLLSADLHRATGGEPIPWDKGQRPGEQVLHTLDPLIRRLLDGLCGVGEDDEALHRTEAGQLAWERLAWRAAGAVADRLLQSVPVSAFAGRTESPEGKPSRVHRASLAERRFLDRRKEILHRAAEARTRRDPDEPGQRQPGRDAQDMKDEQDEQGWNEPDQDESTNGDGGV